MSNIEDDVRILFNLKCYLESLLASGQDKIYYNDLLYDEKTIDCINAIEDLLKERKKYTIRLTDEEYGRVIDIAQKDIAEQKDKRIKELEKENKNKDTYIKMAKEVIENSIPKQKVKEQQEEIEKKDKIIDLMTKEIIMTKPINCTKTNEFSTKKVYMSKEEIKQYFERKVEYVKN